MVVIDAVVGAPLPEIHEVDGSEDFEIFDWAPDAAQPAIAMATKTKLICRMIVGIAPALSKGTTTSDTMVPTPSTATTRRDQGQQPQSEVPGTAATDPKPVNEAAAHPAPAFTRR